MVAQATVSGTVSGIESVRQESKRDAWDRFVARTPGGTIFQTWDWGEARRATGWEPHRLTACDEHSTVVAAAQLGLRRIGPWRVAYCQRGPVWATPEALRDILATLHAFAADAGAAFLKLNPDLELGSPELEGFLEAGFVQNPSQSYMHRATYRVDLTADEATLLRSMEGRTRRAIARSRRDGVQVDSGAEHDLLGRFEALVQATARRRPFAVPSHALLASLLERFAEDGRMRISVARARDHDASAAVHLCFANRCSYLWGGSTDDPASKRSNPSEALHWNMMRVAQSAGCRVYDLHGVHLDAAGLPDGGTAFFKRGFGGTLIRLVGDLELPLRGSLYRAWKELEPVYLRRKGGAS